MVDSAQKQGYHPEIDEMESLGYRTFRMAMPVGDYAIMGKEVKLLVNRRADQFNERMRKYHEDVENGKKDAKKPVFKMEKIDSMGTYSRCVDTKADISELYWNLEGRVTKYTFEMEIQRAKNLGIELLILITDNRYKTDKDIETYQHIFYDKDTGEQTGIDEDAGIQMLKQKQYLEEKYKNVKFEFIDADKATQRIIDFISPDIGKTFKIANNN